MACRIASKLELLPCGTKMEARHNDICTKRKDREKKKQKQNKFWWAIKKGSVNKFWWAIKKSSVAA
jgi:hypothetical protein